MHEEESIVPDGTPVARIRRGLFHPRVGISSLLTAFALAPGTAAAQGTLAGTVTDANGRAPPGTTVVAAGPTFSGKVRSAVTNREGQFTIGDSPAGTYSLTFLLPGHNTLTLLRRRRLPTRRRPPSRP